MAAPSGASRASGRAEQPATDNPLPSQYMRHVSAVSALRQNSRSPISCYGRSRSMAYVGPREAAPSAVASAITPLLTKHLSI